MPDKSNFDSISPYYDRLVRLVFGKSMMHAQSFFLDKIAAGSSVLVLGGGTGLWLNDLVDANPGCKIVYIDSSTKMIDCAKRNTNNSNCIDFRLGTENCINNGDHFNVVIVYCYLDLFTDDLLPEVIAKIRDATTKGSLWIVVDFVSTLWWHKAMLFVMYNFFRITTGLGTNKLPEWERILSHSNLQQIDEKLFYRDFIKSAVFFDRGI